MAFAVHNGAWRTAKVVSVNNGSWRTAKSVWVHDGAAWRPAWVLNSAFAIAEAFGNYGYEASAMGSMTPVGDVPNNIIQAFYYSTVTSPSTYVFSLSNVAATYTKTSYGKEIGIVGGASLNFADASSFSTTGPGGFAIWEWGSMSDTLGLQAANGTTVRLQARKA